ncbi:Nephrin-like protein, partial [Dinothrombium tinctorium]
MICQVNAEPEVLSFKWQLNNSFETVDIHSFVSNGTTSIASYIPRSSSDYGNVHCWGENIVGRQKQPCPPETINNCRVRNQSLDSVYVVCVPGYDGGLKQSFILEVYEFNSNQLYSNLTSVYPEFWIQNLPTNTTFMLNVYAINAKGRSLPFSLKTTTSTAL